MDDKLRDFTRWGIDTRDWSAQTRRQYAGRVAACAVHLAATGRRMETASAAEMLGWLSTLPATPASRNHARKAIAAYCGWMVATGRRSDDPSVELPTLRVRRSVPRALAGDEAARVWAAAQAVGLRAAALVAVMLFGGLRATEARTLQLVHVEGDWLRFAGKGRVTRMVPLHPAAEQALARWLATAPSPVLVFPSPMYPGDPLCYQTVRRMVAGIGDDAGVVGLTAHRLRHTAATGLLEGGADLADCQQFLGHASPQSTAGYLMVRPGRLTAAVARLDYGASGD